MEKKKYTSPDIEIIEIETEGVIAGSNKCDKHDKPGHPCNNGNHWGNESGNNGNKYFNRSFERYD